MPESSTPAVSRPRLSLVTIQLVRKAVLLAVVMAGIPVAVFAESRWPNGSLGHEGIELAGLFLIAVCIVGRTWCSLYIGGLKNRALIDVGPYSITRNPLYALSVVGAVGVGAQLGSVVIALVAGIVTWAVFYILIFSEERRLRDQFGAAYCDYTARVPRFLPEFRLWRDVETLTVRPGIVRATFFDACLFLVSVPIAEAFDYLHDLGIVPVLLRVP
jgi:protein-S-isoprenylcysteine O-methyltransferase Ste14